MLIHSMGEQQTPSTRRAVTSWIKSLPGVYLLIISISFYIHIPREGKQRSYCIGFFFCCKQLTLECNKSMQLAMSSIAKIIIIPTSNHSTLIYEAPSSMCQAMCYKHYGGENGYGTLPHQSLESSRRGRKKDTEWKSL